jgi:hypothetical protein
MDHLGRTEGLDEDDADESENVDVDGVSGLEFALEAFLEEFILTNWEGIDWGRSLKLWESETGDLGHQLATPVGRLDFLCQDTATDALVVVELKRGRPSGGVVGRLTPTSRSQPSLLQHPPDHVDCAELVSGIRARTKRSPLRLGSAVSAAAHSSAAAATMTAPRRLAAAAYRSRAPATSSSYPTIAIA